MSATMELDPILKQALKLLHSSSSDSAEKIRLALDEIIKQRYGSRKMLINSLNKKYLEEESTSPGTSVKRRKSNDSRGSSSLKNTSPPAQPEPMAVEPVTISMSEEENLKEFGDLACVVCGAMVLTAGNRLVECADCHSLYHQECHKPTISDDDANEQEFSWCCTDCKNKVKMSKSASISVPSPSKSSSSSSSSSYTSSHYTKNYEPSSKSKSSSSKGGGGGSSSSSKSTFGNLVSSSTTSSSNAVVGSSSSSSSTNKSAPASSSSSVTPSINIISADQRLQIMKKKAAKQLESKRKHK